MIALARRRLVHAERATVAGEDGFRFHHALIRDAVYAGVPEQSRAELHEAVARVLAERGPERDEAVGYHLEHAAALRAASGEPAARLRQEASRRLGAAGIRAMKRVDGRTAADLIARALALATDEDRELECAFGLALKFSGEMARAESLFEDVAARSAAAGDERIEYLARIEQVWTRLTRGDMTLAEVDCLISHSLEIFESARDDFALGRALHCRLSVNGVYHFRYRDHEALVERIRAHYERAGFSHGSAHFLLAVSAYRGQTPVREAITRCNALVEDAKAPFWRSFILPMLAPLEAMDARFDEARAHLEEARACASGVRGRRIARHELGVGGSGGRVARR